MRQLHEEHVRKAAAKHGAIEQGAACAWLIDVLAARTIDLDVRFANAIRQAQRQHQLLIAVGARTNAKVTSLVLEAHVRDAPPRQYVARMDQSVQLLGHFGMRVVRIEAILHIELRVENGIQSVLKVGHHRLQARQVELVARKFVGHAAQKPIRVQANKPIDPRTVCFGHVSAVV